MKKHLYIFLLMSVALGFRLYPSFISGLPYSTDAWGPIRNTELIIEHTPIHLGDDAVFDGYNNYWPANSLFGAVLSELISVKPITVMALIHPLAGAIGVLIFYVIVKKILGDSIIASVASIFLAIVYPYTMLTAGVMKETYANPIYFLCIFIFLSKWKSKWKKGFLFSIAFVTLVFSHHLTALLTLVTLSSLWLATSLEKWRKGYSFEKSGFISIISLASIFFLYIGFYARTGFTSVPLNDYLSVASYQVVVFVICASLVFGRRIEVKPLLGFSVMVVAVLLITLFSVNTSLLTTASELPFHYSFSQARILTSALIIMGGIYALRRKGGIIPFFWISALLGLEAYSMFGKSGLESILKYRVFNFLWPAFAVLLGIGFNEYRRIKLPKLRQIVKATVIVSLSIIIFHNAYNLYSAVSLQDRYLGYFWLNTVPEFEAGKWVASTINKQTVSGDVKVNYLLKDYFDVPVDVGQGLRYLVGESNTKPEILFVYDQMLKNRYAFFSGYVIDLPEDWTDRTNDLNLIYSNGPVQIHLG